MAISYLPTNDEDLLVWAQNFTACLKEHGAALKLDQETIDEFEVLTLKFESALKKSKGIQHRNKDGVGKNTIVRKLRKLARKIVRGNFYYNPDMTPELRILMRLNAKSSPQKPDPMETTPIVFLELSKAKVIAMYRNEINGRQGKPDGVRFVEYAWGLVDIQPDSPEKLEHFVRKTSGPLTLTFDECDRGKPCCISARWENAHGEPGPWSEIIKIYIP